MNSRPLVLWLQVLATAVIAMGSACAVPPAPGPTQSVTPLDEGGAPLAVTLMLDQTRYAAGVPIMATVVLTNQDRRPLTVEQRWNMGRPVDPAASPTTLAFELLLRTPDGVDIVVDQWKTLAQGQALYFAPLEPTTSISTTVDLHAGHPFSIPGAYVLKVRYTSENTPADGAETWKGQLTSAPVTIEVTTGD